MRDRAFTLVEILVAVTIIALVSSIVVVNLSRSRSRARDQKRKADLLSVQGALELHFATHRRYPSTVGVGGCVPSGLPSNPLWCGEPSGYGNRCYADGCTPGPYIPPNVVSSTTYPGLAPTFIAVLPSDPTKGIPSSYAVQSQAICSSSAQAGYIYISNGTDYKFLSHCTLERQPEPNDPLIDPNRSPGRHGGGGYWALAVYSAGARMW